MDFFQIFVSAVNAILPIVLLIAIGYLLRKINFINDAFLDGANKLVFRVTLPVMLFLNVYNVSDLSGVNWNIVWFSVGAILILFGLGLLSVFLFTKDPRQKGVVLQCIIRSNFAIIGIPLVALLTNNSPEALMVTSVLSLFVIPTSNILSVIALAVYPKGVDEHGLPIKQKIDWGYTLKKIVTNPLIISILAGFVVVLIRPWFYPWTVRGNLTFVFTTADFIGRVTTPLALIALGGAFRFSAAKKMLPQIAQGSIWRVVLAPAIFITIAAIFREQLGFDMYVFPAFIALFSAPVAVTSVVMAEEMDNDAELAGQLVVWSSILSIFTVFAIVIILMSMGLVAVI